MIKGTTAPPTMATQMIPEPSAARGPNPSLAREKIVGNMMELNSPTASNETPDAAPVELADTHSSVMTAAAAHASTLPGDNTRNRYAPMNRPIMAPPQ